MFAGVAPHTLRLESGYGFFAPAKYDIITDTGITKIQAEIDPWYFGNFLFGGIVGLLIVDPATGAMWELPDRVFVNNGIGLNVDTTQTGEFQPSASEVQRHAPGVKRGQIISPPPAESETPPNS